MLIALVVFLLAISAIGRRLPNYDGGTYGDRFKIRR